MQYKETLSPMVIAMQQLLVAHMKFCLSLAVYGMCYNQGKARLVIVREYEMEL